MLMIFVCICHVLVHGNKSICYRNSFTSLQWALFLLNYKDGPVWIKDPMRTKTERQNQLQYVFISSIWFLQLYSFILKLKIACGKLVCHRNVQFFIWFLSIALFIWSPTSVLIKSFAITVSPLFAKRAPHNPNVP